MMLFTPTLPMVDEPAGSGDVIASPLAPCAKLTLTATESVDERGFIRTRTFVRPTQFPVRVVPAPVAVAVEVSVA